MFGRDLGNDPYPIPIPTSMGSYARKGDNIKIWIVVILLFLILFVVSKVIMYAVDIAAKKIRG